MLHAWISRIWAAKPAYSMSLSLQALLHGRPSHTRMSEILVHSALYEQIFTSTATRNCMSRLRKLRSGPQSPEPLAQEKRMRQGSYQGGVTNNGTQGLSTVPSSSLLHPVWDTVLLLITILQGFYPKSQTRLRTERRLALRVLSVLLPLLYVCLDCHYSSILVRVLSPPHHLQLPHWDPGLNGR